MRAATNRKGDNQLFRPFRQVIRRRGIVWAKKQNVPFFAIFFAAILPASALAQTSFPMITHTYPVAVQRGQTAEITVEGQMNFAGAYQMLMQGDGIKAEIVSEAKPTGKQNAVRSVKLKLTVAPDAAFGAREVRLASTLVVSSLG